MFGRVQKASDEAVTIKRKSRRRSRTNDNTEKVTLTFESQDTTNNEMESTNYRKKMLLHVIKSISENDVLSWV